MTTKPQLSQAQKDLPKEYASYISSFYDNLNQSPQKDLTLVEHFISVDSRHRDRVAYPNPNKYAVHFNPATSTNGATIQTLHKNIKSLELVAGRLPNVNSILDQSYLNLEIEELTGPYDATGTGTQKAFAKMYFKSVIGNFVTVSLDGLSYNRKVYQDGEIAGGWSKWIIKITDADGNLFNFGTDSTPPTAPTLSLQNSFTFRLLTEMPDTSKLGRRNI